MMCPHLLRDWELFVSISGEELRRRREPGTKAIPRKLGGRGNRFDVLSTDEPIIPFLHTKNEMSQ
jgi:hypothetical protein